VSSRAFAGVISPRGPRAHRRGSPLTPGGAQGQHNHPPDPKGQGKRKASSLEVRTASQRALTAVNEAPLTLTTHANRRRPRLAPQDPSAVAGLGMAPPRKPALSTARAEETKSKRASAKGVRDVVHMVLHGSAQLEEEAVAPLPKTVAKPPLLPAAPFLDHAAGVPVPEPFSAPFAVPPPDPAAHWPGVGERAASFRGRAIVGHEGVAFGDARLRVSDYAPATGQLGLLFDGREADYRDDYAWRKYGKKEIKGCASNCPRYYWRCTNRACDIKRHTQATAAGLTEVHYYGSHNHLPPPAKRAGRRVARTPRPQAPRAAPAASPWKGGVVEPSEPRYAPRGGYAAGYASDDSDAGSQRPRASEGAATDTSSIATSSVKCSPGPATGASEPLGSYAGIVYSEPQRIAPVNNRCPLFFLACVAANEPLPKTR